MSLSLCRGLCVLTTLLGAMHVVDAQPAGKQRDGWVEILQKDARLNIKINFTTAAHPTSEQVLGHVRKATGVALTLAGEHDPGTVRFGGTSVVNVPAWKVMQQLAKTQVKGGRWEKSGEGYVLHGTPHVFGIAAEKVAANEAMLKAAKEKYAQAAKVAAESAKFHPLGLDPALQVRLTVWETDPPLSNLLDRLRSATGLSLTLDPALAEHEPTFGSVQMKGAYAWMLMELIAETQLEGGRWVKTDAGYRLEGRSTIAPPPPGLTPWQLAGLGGVGACLAALTAALALRALRRARPTRGTSA